MQPIRQNKNNQLRVIGGEWRSRKITFPAIEALRPTPDRVRETVFNWLRWDVEGANCLDLFAGSGILGVEAASRGAKDVVLVDYDADVCRAIMTNLNALGARQVKLLQMNVMHYLANRLPRVFDLIFLDPPFRRGLIVPCIDRIEKNGWVTDGSKIYIETESELTFENIPPDWNLLKSKKFGSVGSHLFEKIIKK